jgi:hypothetical protein
MLKVGVSSIPLGSILANGLVITIRIRIPRLRIRYIHARIPRIRARKPPQRSTEVPRIEVIEAHLRVPLLAGEPLINIVVSRFPLPSRLCSPESSPQPERNHATQRYAPKHPSLTACSPSDASANGKQS